MDLATYLVPNGRTLPDFAVGSLDLATMATLHLRALHIQNQRYLSCVYHDHHQQNLLGCNHQPLARPPEPKMVGFFNLVQFALIDLWDITFCTQLGSVAGLVIQANGRLIFEDDLRSGCLLYFTTQYHSGLRSTELGQASHLLGLQGLQHNRPQLKIQNPRFNTLKYIN